MAGSSPGIGTSLSSGPLTLAAGIVAYNEEPHLRTAVRSLIDQKLPEGVDWGEIWVVASGCTDRTVEIAHALAEEEPRVRVVVEPDRGGKARALRQVFQRASGDALVLLNSDARAEPGAVEQLVRVAEGKEAPFAVMARPVVPREATGPWAPTFRWMWHLHHEFHAQLLSTGTGGHLSDELLLVSLPSVPPIPDGIINDGSYLAVWLAQHSGGRWYAADARVSIEVPGTVGDHLRQRRRIHVGNAQVTSVLREPPSTIPRQLIERPVDTARLLRKMIAREGGVVHFGRLAAWELTSYVLAAWDRLPPQRDHVRWHRARSTGPLELVGPQALSCLDTQAIADFAVPLEHRITAVVGAASQFGTGILLPELLRLLPNDAPATVPEVRDWLETRPHLARVEGESAFAPETLPTAEQERLERGRHYLDLAKALLAGPLRGARAVSHCVCVTGSAAYGMPQQGDDLDLFVVTRTGGLWWFLAYSYLCIRIARRRRTGGAEATPCFNLVLEDGAALGEFARSQGFLFAREALTAQPIHGDEYYRGLLSKAGWMKEEIPRLYSEKNQGPVESGSLARPAPILVRLLSAAVFPWLAAYLQLAGLRRDRGFRQASMPDHRFRTETRWRRLAFASRKFERLRESYRAPSPFPPTAVSESRSSNPNGPTSRRRYAGTMAAPSTSD
ncbi:MAG: glycosyltransferase family 2 protein [Thermoplasmata archaeon]